jgi:hypothetical protein
MGVRQKMSKRSLTGWKLALSLAIGAGVMMSAGSAGASPRSPLHEVRGVQLLNLHTAWLKALPHVKPHKISGVIYARGHQPKAAAAIGPRSNTACTEPNCPLTYNGGPIQQHPHLYLLFWGPNWSSYASTETYMIEFYRSLGDQPSDTWSAVTSQYTQTGGNFPEFSGSVLVGAYGDTSTPPTGADQTQLAAEADGFASAQGLTDLGNAQIIIATQPGTCPAGFYSPSVCGTNTGYCAWHSASNEPYTNMPYVLDAGTGCGENFVNSGSAGTYDGISIVGGHEYGETITDPVPDSGWIDLSDGSGGEIGDKCAWQPGAGDITIGSGTFAVQGLYSNALHGGGSNSNGCALSYNYGPRILSQPSSQTVNSGASVTFTSAGAGSPWPSIVWQVSTNSGSSWTNLKSQTSPNYTLTAIGADNGRLYRAAYYTATATKFTSAAILTVITKPSITSNPTSQDVPRGTVVTFTAGATGATSVVWQVSTNSGSSWITLTNQTTDNYTLTAIAIDNGREYRAVFKNSAGTTPTSAATLTVT